LKLILKKNVILLRVDIFCLQRIVVFLFKEVKTDESIMEEVYKFRCEILCEELKYFKIENYPDKKEKDHYDNYANHFIALDEKGEIVAYIRLIYFNHYGFPLEENMEIYDKYKNLPKKEIAEISRLFIKKDYRGFKNTIFILENFLKLFVYKKSKEKNIKYLYATLQTNFLRLLKVINMHFKIIGDEQEYGDKRYPTILAIKDLEKDRPDLKNIELESVK